MNNIKKASMFWFYPLHTQDVSVGILARPRNGQPKKHSSTPDRTTDFYFLLFRASRPAGGATQPPNLRAPRVLFTVVQRTWHYVNHSPPSDEFKNVWGYISTPPYALTAGTGTTLRASF